MNPMDSSPPESPSPAPSTFSPPHLVPLPQPPQEAAPRPSSAQHEQRALYIIQATLLVGLFVGGVLTLIRYELRPGAEPLSPAVERGRNARATGPARTPPGGYIEAENLPLISKSSDFDYNRVDMSAEGNRWFGHSHMLASQTKLNDWVELEYQAPESGRFALSVYMTRIWFFGIVELTWNGRRVGPALDLYSNKGVQPTGEIRIGTVAVKRGRNTLRLQVVGHSPEADPGKYEFALDGIRLVREGR